MFHLTQKNTKILDINVIESLKEKFTKRKTKKNQKKRKRKNLTPSSSKTIFHTLITLKDIFLAHHVTIQKIVQKQSCLQLQKKIQKNQNIKKKKAFLFCGPIQNLNLYIQKIFLTFNN